VCNFSNKQNQVVPPSTSGTDSGVDVVKHKSNRLQFQTRHNQFKSKRQSGDLLTQTTSRCLPGTNALCIHAGVNFGYRPPGNMIGRHFTMLLSHIYHAIFSRAITDNGLSEDVFSTHIWHGFN